MRQTLPGPTNWKKVSTLRSAGESADCSECAGRGLHLHVRHLENKRRQEALPWRWGRSSCSSRWWPPADRRETAPRSRTWTWSRAGKQRQQYTPVSMHQLTISHLVVLNTRSGDYSLNRWVKSNSETRDASLSSCWVISVNPAELKGALSSNKYIQAGRVWHLGGEIRLKV